MPQARGGFIVGLGYGAVLRIDNDEVWGAEVNAASKLGEEMAKGGEVLVTDTFHQAVSDERFVACGELFGTRTVYSLSGL